MIRSTACEFRTGSGQPRRASPVKDTRPVQESPVEGGGRYASKPFQAAEEGHEIGRGQ